MAYPGSIASLTDKSDGTDQIIYAAHINAIHTALRDLRTVLGDAPQGNKSDLESRIDVLINDDGNFIGPGQCRIVAKSGGQYTSIQSALNSISDAASNKQYAVFIFPGHYDEEVTTKDFVHLVGINRKACWILAPLASYAVIGAGGTISNLTLYSARTQATISIGSGEDLGIFNCDVWNTASYAIQNSNGTLKAYYSYFSNTSAYTLYHIDGTSSCWFCIFEPSSDGEVRVDAGTVNLFHCDMISDGTASLVNSGATLNARLCSFGSYPTGVGTIDLGTMSGACSNRP